MAASTARPTSFHQVGDAVEALKYAVLYWPKLIEFRGAVFLALSEGDETEIESRLTAPSHGRQRSQQAPLSWQATVDSYNIFEVAHLFRQWHGLAELSEDVHRNLGEFLVCTWRSRLLEAYPSGCGRSYARSTTSSSVAGISPSRCRGVGYEAWWLATSPTMPCPATPTR
jgi:hypothetical protein